MELIDLKPSEGSKKKKKREGRGRSGYGGKTAGRGHNGQGQRAGGAIRKQFEGGQTPLYRRLPKHQYISSPNKKSYTIINISDLNSLDLEKDVLVTEEFLLEKGILKKIECSGVKVLGNGEINKPIKLKVSAFSSSAKEKIEQAGGTIEKIERS